MAWFFNLSIQERITGLFLLAVSSTVMFICWKSLLRQRHGRIGWYRGIHSSPAFQFLMWGLAAPLILPFLYLALNRWRTLHAAPLVGNLWSSIVHRKGCKYERQITVFFNRIPFESLEESENAGYRGCRYCKPR